MTVLIVLIVGAAMLVAERLWPANQLPKSGGWWGRVVFLNLAQGGVVFLAGASWDRWFQRIHLFDVGSMPAAAQAAIGYMIITFVYYWWHRMRHESAFFWRLCHQIHHSPRRMEIAMSFYKHPVEITLNGVLSSAIYFPLLGLDPAAAAAVSITTGIAEFFYHWNIRTPRWLGFLFQRPESHRVHHRRSHHTDNYSDIPLWDMLFGTVDNPSRPVPKCGFETDKEERFVEMLAFRDVHLTAPGTPLPICFGCSKRWICQSARESHPNPSER